MKASQRLNEFNAEQMNDNSSDLVPVHLSWDEVMYFNIMQGGQSVDENTGLREYTKLSEVLKVPQIRNLFITISDLLESGEPIPQDIEQLMDTPVEQEDNGVEPIKSDSNPENVLLDETGEGHDKIIVMMPQDVVHFLDFIQGGEKTDPTLGLQEFGWFGDFFKNPVKTLVGWGKDSLQGKLAGPFAKSNIVRSVARVGATVVGAWLGSYIGQPALGGALGNMFGRYTTGQKIGKDMLIAGAKNGLYSWAGSSALSAMGAGAGAAGAGAAGAAGGAGASAAPAASSAALAAPAANAGVTAAAPSMLSSIMSSKYLPSAALLAAGTMMSNKGAKEKEQEDLKRYYAEKEENEQRKRRTFANLNEAPEGTMLPEYGELPQHLKSSPRFNYKIGGKVGDIDPIIRSIFKEHKMPHSGISFSIFKKKLNERGISLPEKELSSLYNTYDGRMEEEAMPSEVRKWQSELKKQLQKEGKIPYKTGGKVVGIEIKGKGTGQSDDIPKTVPENSWVWDATTVAHAGDGTTNAGQRALATFEHILKSKKLPHVKEVIETSIKSKPLRNVPCALSNGERVTPPHLVAAAGDGSFDKGAIVLKKMTKELRRHKASKGLDLPPSAHELEVYYKKACRGV